MKSRDIQRSVQAQRIERAEGDAPSIGRVPRVPGTGLPKGTRRKHRRGEGPRGNRERINRKRVMIAWSALLMTIAIGVLCVALWMRVRPGNRMSETSAGKKGETMIEERVVSEFKSPTENEALLLVKNAMTVRDAEKVEDLFRCGTTKPEEVVGFLRKMENQDGAISDYEWLSSMDANGMLLDGVQVHFKTLKGLRSRLAFLTPDERGHWKVDFNAFARTVNPQWSEIIGNKAVKAVVRVMVAPDSYYNGDFKDEEKWSCYGMASPDHETIFLGYCRKDSPQAKAMERIMAAGEDLLGIGRRLGRATLEISRPEKGDERQFEITRVLAQDWVVTDKPYDARER